MTIMGLFVAIIGSMVVQVGPCNSPSSLADWNTTTVTLCETASVPNRQNALVHVVAIRFRKEQMTPFERSMYSMYGDKDDFARYYFWNFQRIMNPNMTPSFTQNELTKMDIIEDIISLH